MTEHSGVSLSTPIEQLKSVGSKNLPRLRRLGITSVRHLLWHFPARYEDYSRVVPIAELEAGQKVNIQGEVIELFLGAFFPGE